LQGFNIKLPIANKTKECAMR